MKKNFAKESRTRLDLNSLKWNSEKKIRLQICLERLKQIETAVADFGTASADCCIAAQVTK